MRIGGALLSVVAAVCGLVLAQPARAACQLQTLAELPVVMQGLRATVQAKINGQDASFVLDSGAFFSSMSAASAARYGLPLGPAPFGMEVRGVGGGRAQVSVATVTAFDFGGHVYKDVEFIVLDAGSLGTASAGLIGENVLGAEAVEYDLADGVVRIFKTNGCGFDDELAYWAGSQPYSVVQIDPPERGGVHTRAQAMLNGVPIHVEFDTGSPRSIISRSAAARAGVKPGDPGVVVAGVGSGVGQRSFLETWRGPFASFKLAGEEVRNQTLLFGDIGLPESDMLLGADFFLSHRILISNSQHRLYFTYNGGPVFNLGPATQAARPPQPPAGSPGDAADLERHALAMLVRGDAGAAIADLNQAITLDPKAARYHVERARAEREAHEPLKAMDDFNQALALKPDDVDALLGRARLSFALHNLSGGRSDLDAAAKAVAGEPDTRLELADLDMDQQQYAAAATQFDLWLAEHPNSDLRVRALKGGCDARGYASQELDKGLADCNAALKLDPGNPAVLMSRGLVLVRIGQPDKALLDFAAAIKLEPANGWPLYGKGVAELHLGRTADGQADIARAAQLTPTLPAEAKRLGLTP